MFIQSPGVDGPKNNYIQYLALKTEHKAYSNACDFSLPRKMIYTDKNGIQMQVV